MSLQVEAVYENGILKPAQDLPFAPGQRVVLTIQPIGGAAKRFCGSLRWNRGAEELERYLDNPDESSWSAHDV